MKKLLTISLLFAFTSVIAQNSSKEKRTYIDSLEKAFDNVCFIHDSLVNELEYQMTMNFLCEADNNARQELINNLTSEIQIAKQIRANLDEIIKAKDKDIAELKKLAKRAKRKGIVNSVAIGVGGFSLGAILTAITIIFSN
jgi:hypothetical protein